VPPKTTKTSNSPSISVPKGIARKKWRVRLWRTGLEVHEKLSYPARYGRYHELITTEGTYHLGLDGFPKYLQGCHRTWPHPQEWLKLTRGGDWIYYSVQGYSDVFDLTGEYYYPFLSYGSNPVFFRNPLQSPVVVSLLTSHDERCRQAAILADDSGFSPEERELLRRFSTWTFGKIKRYGARLHQVLRARIPVLPPDCRHVDYDVLPLMVTEGCLANCGFCRIKTAGEFRVRCDQEITAQLQGLRELFGPELANYRGLFLGQHDALAAGAPKLAAAVEQALAALALGREFVKDPVVFLFASTRSFLALSENDLSRLNGLGCRIFINIGLESFDQKTLDLLKKPVRARDNIEAFQKMLAVTHAYEHIEVSGNLVMGSPVGEAHLERMVDVLSSASGRPGAQTPLYLSPLLGSYQRTAILSELRRIKSSTRLPVFLYLIQRL